jgi:hypothetical protein
MTKEIAIGVVNGEKSVAPRLRAVCQESRAAGAAIGDTA